MATRKILISEDELRALRAAAAKNTSYAPQLTEAFKFINSSESPTEPMQITSTDNFETENMATSMPPASAELPSQPALPQLESASASQPSSLDIPVEEASDRASPVTSISQPCKQAQVHRGKLEKQELDEIPFKFKGLACQIVHFLNQAPTETLGWNRGSGGDLRILGSSKPHPVLTFDSLVLQLLYPPLGTKGVPLDLIELCLNSTCRRNFVRTALCIASLDQQEIERRNG